MATNLLLYADAFIIENNTHFCEKVEILYDILQKARHDMGDNIFQSSDFLMLKKISPSLFFYDILNFEKDTEVLEIMPDFSNDIRVLMLEILGYQPTAAGSDLEALSIQFPNQNNGLAGLHFTDFEDKNKCVWHEESWYNFHYQYFAQNPHDRYFIERQKSLQGTEFNPYFPNLKYSNQLAPEGWGKFKEMLNKFPNEKITMGMEMANKIAKINFYQPNEELSSYNQKIKNSLRQIFESIDNENKIYLSTDFEGCNAFEVCDKNGRHLGEFLFDGRKNKDRDGSGKHDIILKP